MLGYPAEQHIDKGTEIQNKTPDPDFVRVIDRGWRYCLSRSDVDGARVGVIGYCMGGAHRHSLRRGDAGGARVRRLLSVGTRRSSRRESDRAIPTTPRVKSNVRRWCSTAAQDRTSTFPIQQKVMESFHANGQPLEWHYFHFGNHGFASTESDGYQPYLADLAWPLVTEFLGRELIGPAP